MLLSSSHPCSSSLNLTLFRVYGVLTTQVYTYYEKYRQDRIQYKILAAALWVASTVDQCLIGHVVYYYSVT